MVWVIRFSLVCLASIGAALAIVWAVNGFSGLGLDTNGVIALVLGMIFTSALGVGLMALVFSSNREARDQAAYDAGKPHDGPPPP
jgi:hypothetical protein